MKYSVLLLYPDYTAENYGQDTFYDLVEADTPAEAIFKARDNAIKSNPEMDFEDDPEDFFLLLLIRGHHMALSDGCGRLI